MKFIVYVYYGDHFCALIPLNLAKTYFYLNFVHILPIKNTLMTF